MRMAIAALMGAVLVAVIGAVGASALSYTNPQTIGKAGDSHGFPRIAVDSEGRGTVVWHNYEHRNGRIQAVQVDAGGRAGSPRVLSDPAFDSSNAEIGLDGNGRATIVWQGRHGNEFPVQWTRLDADGSQTPVENLTSEGSAPEIAVNAAGAAVVAWSDMPALRAVVIQPNGSLGPVQTLDTYVSTVTTDLKRVAIDASGRATVAWESDHHRPTIYASRFNASGIAGQPRALSDPGKVSFIGSLAVDQAGNSTVAWMKTINKGQKVQMAQLAPDGTPGRVYPLSSRGYVGPPHVVVDGSGQATVAWTTRTALLWNRLEPGGAPARKRKLKGASVDDMAVDDVGRVTIAWNETGDAGPQGPATASIQAMRISPEGKARRAKTLSNLDEDTYDFQGHVRPDVAVDGAGTASVVWPDLARANARIRLGRSTATLKGRVSARKTQKQKGRKVLVRVRVKAGERLTAATSGEIVSGRRGYGLRPQTRAVRPGSSKILKLKPAKSKNMRKIVKALKNGKKAKAILTVRLTSRAGSAETRKLAVKLKR